MKKFTSLFAALMLIVSCAFAQTTAQLREPAGKKQVTFTKVHTNVHKIVKDGETAVDLAGAAYYGQDYIDVTGSQVEVDMYFMGDGLAIGTDGYIHGTGDYITVYFITSAVDADLFVAPGTYTVSDSYDPMTVVRGLDVYAEIGYPGYAYDGTMIQSVRNDSLIGTTFVTGGTVTVAGTGANATITMNFTTPNANYIYNGAVETENYETDWYEYETEEGVTINFTKAAGVEEIEEGSFLLTAEGDNGYTAKLVLYGATPNGTFTCGADPDDTTEGTFMYSKGCDGQSVYYSCAFVLDEDGYIDGYESIYFFTGGSITVAEDGANITVTGTITTSKGNNMVFNYSGKAAVENAEANFNVYTNGLTMHVEAENYVVYNAAGQLVYNGNASEITLPVAGVYFVNANNSVKTVVVK